MSNRSDNPNKTLFLFILAIILLSILSGCGRDTPPTIEPTNSIEHVNGKLSHSSKYYKSCIEGVTYLTGSHSSISVMLDKDSQIIPCEIKDTRSDTATQYEY